MGNEGPSSKQRHWMLLSLTANCRQGAAPPHGAALSWRKRDEASQGHRSSIEHPECSGSIFAGFYQSLFFFEPQVWKFFSFTSFML